MDGVVLVAAEDCVGRETAGSEGKGVVFGLGGVAVVVNDAVEAGAVQELLADDVADVLRVRVRDGRVLGGAVGQLELRRAVGVELRHQQLDSDVC